MIKLIIDPCLFEAPSDMSKADQFSHFMLLKDSIDFASDNFDVCLDEYDGAPYSGNSDSPPYAPPITKSLIVRNRYSEISKKILKLICRGDWIDLHDKLVDGCSLQFEEDTVAEKRFKQYLYYIVKSEAYGQSLILLSQKNSTNIPSVSICLGKIEYAISSLFNPAIDCNGIVSNFLKKSESPDSMFPHGDACNKLNNRFKEDIIRYAHTSAEKQSLYIKFGVEVASRNGYQKSPDISRKNPSYEVFIHTLGSYYLSIDREHGGLEMFKCHGSHSLHLGEYDFSCTPIKKAEPETHKLVV